MVMALIKCPECGKEVSDKALSCPKCGCPINVIVTETEQERINVRRKNKGKICLIFGGILFLVSIVFSISVYETTLGLSARKVTRGLYGSDAIKYFFLHNVPDWLLWIAIILFIVGIIFLIISRKNKT